LRPGHDDVLVREPGFAGRCDPHRLDTVTHAREQKRIKPEHAEIAHIPTTTVPVADRSLATALENPSAALDEDEDVKTVFANEEIDDSIAP